MQLAFRTGASFIDKTEATSKEMKKTKEEITSSSKNISNGTKVSKMKTSVEKNNVSENMSSTATIVGQEIEKIIKSEEKVKNVYLCIFD